jgi:hypothetical protein
MTFEAQGVAPDTGYAIVPPTIETLPLIVKKSRSLL